MQDIFLKQRKKEKGTPIVVLTSHYIVKFLINLLTHIKNISLATNLFFPPWLHHFKMQTNKPQQTLRSNQQADWACSHWHQCFQTVPDCREARSCIWAFFSFFFFFTYFPDPWWDCRWCKRSVKKKQIDLKNKNYLLESGGSRMFCIFPYSLQIQRSIN